MDLTHIIESAFDCLTGDDINKIIEAQSQVAFAEDAGNERQRSCAEGHVYGVIEDIVKGLPEYRKNDLEDCIRTESFSVGHCLERFQDSRARYNLLELINAGNETASLFAKIEMLDPEQTEVFGYSTTGREPDLFIEIMPAEPDQGIEERVTLDVGEGLWIDPLDQLPMLEEALFEWALKKGRFDR